MSTIISVEDASMRFNLAREKVDTIKEYIIKAAKHKLLFDEFYALKNVTFDIKQGETVAVIGNNGSGKSTLLKMIAGVIYPTTGKVKVDGTVAPLIELGAGFDMELTAKENIYLNGAVLGHDHKYMQNCFDEVIDFAELEDFINVPIKNFSSGMIARLGFSIATAVKADILVVDEILSVGDIGFQKKCHDRIMEMIKDDVTLIFVSHNMQQVCDLCSRTIWLDKGRIVMDGTSNIICKHYKESI